MVINPKFGISNIVIPSVDPCRWLYRTWYHHQTYGEPYYSTMLLLVLLRILSFIVVTVAWVPAFEHRTTTFVKKSVSSSWTLALTTTTTTSRSLVSTSQIAVLDGAEWVSFQECWKQPQRTKQSTSSKPQKSKFGYVNVVVGTVLNNNDNGNTNKQQRVIGVQALEDDITNNIVVALSDQVYIYRDSMAVVPPAVKDADAISTFIASMSVHCCLPKIENVGGSTDNDVVILDSSGATANGSSFVIPGSKVRFSTFSELLLGHTTQAGISSSNLSRYSGCCIGRK